jgi:hypothetical protein
LSVGEQAGGTSSVRDAEVWQVRILDPDGRKVLGGGVLLSERHVLTCAHVLGDADRPDAEFVIDFPRSTSTTSALARVAADGWLPKLADGRRDIAVLEFDGDVGEDIRPAFLGHGRPCVGHPAEVYGHPAGIPDGVWTKGELARTTGPHGEWIQLRGELARHHERVEPGFSGGGVIDLVSGRTVGIVVAAFTGTDRQAAWMIPMEVAAGYSIHVRDALPDDSHADDTLDDQVIAGLARIFTGFDSVINDESRARIIDRLPAAVAARLASPSTSVTALVQACRRRTDMRCLADLATFYEGPSQRSRELDAALENAGVGRLRGSPEQVDSVSEADRDRLVRALCRLPRFQNAQDRRVYLAVFRSRLHDQRNLDLQVLPSDDAVADAGGLVDACLPIPGALQLFLDTIPVMDHDQPGFGELMLQVEALCTERLLTDAERREILRLLRQIPPEMLVEGHRYAAPSSRSHGVRVGPPHRLVPLLESYAQSPGRPPRIIVFTEFLAHQVPGARAALHRWAESTSARLRLYHSEVEALRQEVRRLPVDRAPSVLMVQLSPDAIDTERFLLTATIQHDNVPQRVIELIDEPETIADLRARVDRLFARVMPMIRYDLENFLVEVILPRALITEPVDQWPVTDIMQDPMGSRFRVVLRSLERLRHEMLRPQWMRKWQLAAEQSSPGEHVMLFLDAGRGLSAAQVRAALRPDDKIVLAIGEPPARQREFTPHDAYAAGLSSGVAYILWVRDPALSQTFRDALSAALRNGPVVDLPAVIEHWRRTPDETALGSHTSLLCCDANRIPGQSTGLGLRPPVMRGES